MHFDRVKYVANVIKRCETFERAGIWPDRSARRLRSWIENFDKKDQPVAAAIADQIVFFSDTATEYLFSAAYTSLIRSKIDFSKDVKFRRDAIKRFLDETIWVSIAGEKPNPTDSGYKFCRLLRDRLRIPENHILSPEDAITCPKGISNIVLVDDFCGSGDQISKTFVRDYNGSSFQQISTRVSVEVLLLIATSYGLEQMEKKGAILPVFCCHLIDETYDIRNRLAPAECRHAISVSDIVDLISRYSADLEVADWIDPCWGYRELGLTIAFSHSIPDSSLPILWAPKSNNWQPFKERV